MAFLRLPSSCANPLLDDDELHDLGAAGHGRERELQRSGRRPLRGAAFAPTIEARPTTNVADAPSGLHVDLHLPQKNEDPEGLGEADLQDATVTLPAG